MIRLEIVLILTQDSCTVCVERAIGSEIIWTHPIELLGDMGHVECHFFCFETVLVLAQDRCMVCARHTIGSEIILEALDATTS